MSLGRLIAIIWILCLGSGSSSWAQPAETRVALVIGNSSYTSAPGLPNPVRDAATVAQAFRDAGFKTAEIKTDLGYDEMRRTLRDFSAEADKADWAVVYFAGHGLEMGGQNYLVPVDARLKSDRDVQFETVPLDQVMGSIEGARKLRLVILDACRDNPFIQQMTRTMASRSIGRGLARVEPEGGTLVAYAAKAGQVALDGDGQNSPFASALVKHINMPGVEIRRLFGLVRDDVLGTTNKQQEPFVYGSLGGEELFFRHASVSSTLGTPQPSLPRPDAPSAPALGTQGPTSQTVTGLLRSFEGHQDYISSVAFSPDGQRVLSGSNDRTLRLWDVNNGRLLLKIDAHQAAVKSAAFSPDSQSFLSGGGHDRAVRLWSASTGKLVREFKGHERWVTSVAFSPDGQRVLSGSEDKTVRLWNASTGKLLREFKGHEGAVTSVAFSPDGQQVLSGSGDTTVRLWDANTGRALFIFEGHKMGISSVAFSPDGQRILSAGDRPLRLWDVNTGQLLRTIGGQLGFERSIAFSPDGQRLLTGSYDTLMLWNTSSGLLIGTLKVPERNVQSVAFSPDGQRAVSGSIGTSGTQRGNVVRLWDVATGAGLATR